MKGTVTFVGELRLETQRLVLRPLMSTKEIRVLQDWWENDKAANEYLDRRHPFGGPADLVQNLRVVPLVPVPGVERPAAPPYNTELADWITFAVFLKHDQTTPVGVMGLYDFNWYHGFCQMRSFIRNTYRLAGYGKESTIGIMEFLYEELLDAEGLPFYKAIAQWMVPNVVSLGLYEACGFQVLEGVLREHVRIGHKRHDMAQGEFLRPQWLMMKKTLGPNFPANAKRWERENRSNAISSLLRTQKLPCYANRGLHKIVQLRLHKAG